jgi:hypothetical protein
MVVHLKDIEPDGLNEPRLSTPSGCFLLCVIAILLFLAGYGVKAWQEEKKRVEKFMVEVHGSTY